MLKKGDMKELFLKRKLFTHLHTSCDKMNNEGIKSECDMSFLQISLTLT